MGIEHIILKVKHILPINCIVLAFCSFPLLNKIMAAIIDTTISIKIAKMKNQNKIMVGAFSINITPPNFYFLRNVKLIDLMLSQH